MERLRPLTHPARLVRALLSARRPTVDYAALYDNLAALALTDEDIVGRGDFDLFGRIELAILVDAGLRPADVLVDFGCGTGRLALHAVRFLEGGQYIGVEISEAILRRAERNVAKAHPDPPCRLRWVHSTARTFPLADASADMICAFSVFTHLEHEDSYQYLCDAVRVVRPGGRFVFSCLAFELEAARRMFCESAARSLSERWRRVRNVITSRDLAEGIASLAGWRVVAWHRGDEPAFAVPGLTERMALGQSVCVLERPRGA